MTSRSGSRLLASYTGWKNRVFRPLWSWQEDRAVDRYARALLKGRFRSARAAAVPCRAELEELRLGHPDEPWAVAPRSVVAVRSRVVHRARALGARWPASAWLPPERRLAEHHARRFLDGRCPSIKQAARDCKRDIERTFDGSKAAGGLTIRRPLYGIYSHIIELVRDTGWSRPDGYWSPQELRVTGRFARGVVRGRFPSASAAARACLAEFDRLRRTRPAPAWLAHRRFLGISRVVCRQALEYGRPKKMPAWSASELRRAERLTRAVMAGRIPTAIAAAREFRRRPGRTDPHRTLGAIEGKICELGRLLGREPLRRRWSSRELTVLRRYARAFDADRFPSLLEAARRCQAELARLPGQPRTVSSVQTWLHHNTAYRGRRWRRLWTPDERRARTRWTSRYEQWRRDGDVWALGRAADGLMRDLARIGTTRSRTACLRQLIDQHVRRRR